MTAPQPTAVGVAPVVRGPIGVDGFWQPRRFAFWMLIFLLANGAFSVISMFYQGSRVVPTATILGIVVWAAYTAIPLLFFHSLDLFQQHPPLGYVLAFAWGGLGALYLAIPANGAINSIVAKTTGSQDWAPAIAGPTTEELLKYLGVILLVLIARTQFRTILSVVAIGAVVGLGFQVIEDLDYTVNTAISIGSPNEVVPVLLTLAFRGIVSGLWSHALLTSISAFGLGWFLVHKHKPLAQRLAVAAGAYALAWLGHFFWNSPLLRTGNPYLDALTHGLPMLLVGYLIWRLAGREEAGYLTGLADTYVDQELITADERKALASLRYRRHLHKEAKKTYGRKAARRYRTLQRRQLHLVLQYGQHGPGGRTGQAALEVQLARADFAAKTGVPDLASARTTAAASV
ncbi:PrsW family intramembrane metalloprotease [Actinoplanes sichuanensis]|uniref:PrsW family intramembrane metalloprotease n=1 Tax=Actinoplanes sichuanensis TaxID=512349 RepID=A0ABW4A208_9ACTN|nr:PrsW family glutamic-type intramembrane protease [Actinoplanes sichuanensis]BEL12989.1 PrsW family intramembrane metalloprotease [Actinoplanes sichuanensis]